MGQVEDEIFDLGVATTDLEWIMPMKRFQCIRTHLAFRCQVSDSDLKNDAAARIRPLINILKARCKKFVDVGRDVAVDESSIACRSKYARHMICYNPSKPTGKALLKFYVCVAAAADDVCVCDRKVSF